MTLKSGPRAEIDSKTRAYSDSRYTIVRKEDLEKFEKLRIMIDLKFLEDISLADVGQFQRTGECESLQNKRNLELVQDCISLRDKSGKTLLLHAAENGMIFTAKVLVKLGAKFDATDDQGNTGLHLLCKFIVDREKKIRNFADPFEPMFLNSGVSLVNSYLALVSDFIGNPKNFRPYTKYLVNIRNNAGLCPLSIAILGKHDSLAIELLRNNASPYHNDNMCNIRINTPIIRAFKMKMERVLAEMFQMYPKLHEAMHYRGFEEDSLNLGLYYRSKYLQPKPYLPLKKLQEAQAHEDSVIKHFSQDQSSSSFAIFRMEDFPVSPIFRPR